jgi:hypothetical protein
MAILKINAGDVFAIPAALNGAEGFVLARCIHDENVTLLEVFKSFCTDISAAVDRIDVTGLVPENWLIRPVKAGLDFNKYFGLVKWPILAENPAYEVSMSNFDEIEFADSAYHQNRRYWRRNTPYAEPPGVCRSLNDMTLWSPDQLISMINFRLAGLILDGEGLNPQTVRRLMDQYGGDSPLNWIASHAKAGQELSDRVAGEFKRLLKLKAERQRREARKSASKPAQRE